MKKQTGLIFALVAMRAFAAGVLDLECEDSSKQIKIEPRGYQSVLTVKSKEGAGPIMPDLDPRAFKIKMEFANGECTFTSSSSIQCYHRDCMRLYLFDQDGNQLNYMPPVAEIWFSSLPHYYITEPQTGRYEYEFSMMLREGQSELSDRIVSSRGAFLTYPKVQCKLPEWKP